MGLCLGALGAALAATAQERIDRVALVAPPVEPAAALSETHRPALRGDPPRREGRRGAG